MRFISFNLVQIRWFTFELFGTKFTGYKSDKRMKWLKPHKKLKYPPNWSYLTLPKRAKTDFARDHWPAQQLGNPLIISLSKLTFSFKCWISNVVFFQRIHPKSQINRISLFPTRFVKWHNRLIFFHKESVLSQNLFETLELVLLWDVDARLIQQKRKRHIGADSYRHFCEQEMMSKRW